MAMFSAIRPEERRATWSALITLFGFMASHAMLETARDALFLAKVSFSRLPWVYLAIAVFSLILAQLRARSQGSERRRSLELWLGLAAVVDLVFWVLVGRGATWVFYALYVWSGVIATLILVQFWLAMGDRFTATEAKRVFAVIGTGSVLGAILGSGLAALLSLTIGARQLIVVAAGLLAATALVSRLFGTTESDTSKRPRTGLIEDIYEWLIGHRAPKQRTGRTLGESLALLRSAPYAKRVAVVVLLSTVTLTLADFVFKRAIDTHVAPDQMGTVFATIYFGLNVGSLVVQVGLVGWLIRRLSLTTALAILPIILFGGALGFAIIGGLAAAIVIKGIDGTFKHTLHRTTTELLYVPMPERVRSTAKTMIDVLGQRGSQAAASIGILGLVALKVDSSVFGFILAGSAAVWCVAALELRRHYINLFRGSLQRGLIRTRIQFPEFDVSSLESLMASLNSANDAEVLAALEILAEQNKIHMVQVFILFHPSPEVVTTAAAYFADAGREDFLPLARRRYKDDASAEVRAGLVRAVSRVDPDQDELRVALSSSDPALAATALTILVGLRAIHGEEATTMLAAAASSEDVTTQLALARALAHHKSDELAGVAITLAAHPNEDVLRATATAMEKQPDVRYLPSLLRLLRSHWTREAARHALKALGDPAFAALESALEDQSVPVGIRLHVPQTLIRFDPDRAADVLIRHLRNEADGVIRYKAIRGLSQLRIENPRLKLDQATLRDGTERGMTLTYELMDTRLTLERGAAEEPARATPVQQLLVRLLKDKEKNSIDRLMRVLSLQYSASDIHRVRRGLSSTQRETRSSSRELLEGLLRRSIREPMMGLVDDASDHERLARAGALYRARKDSYEDVLRQLLTHESESIRSLVVYHVGELGLRSLQPEIETLEVSETSALREIVERALSRLAAGSVRAQELALES
jgi:ATP:ADP antiporter, AAA family